jgi:uncharacterized protein (TIGR00661 family)
LKKTVVFGVLDWGLGHASRSIPLIDNLIARGVLVIIASSGYALAMLKIQYPDLQFITLPSYRIKFAKNNSIIAPIISQLPHIQYVISREHRILEEFISAHPVDGIISDNRYGLWSKKVPSVFITHQVFLKIPKPVQSFTGLVNQIHHRFIKRFNSCWIPDYPGDQNLSGDLSHAFPISFPHEFIGPLSRFNSVFESNSKFRYDAVAVLSGPEPQRSIFEEILLRQMADADGQFCLVRGLPGSSGDLIGSANVEIFNYLNNKELTSILANSKLLICRSGYSTLMDLAALEKPAILVPTPGQSEQEYLAEYHERKGHFHRSSQKSFQLKTMTEGISAFSGIKNRISVDLRANALDSFIGKL